MRGSAARPMPPRPAADEGPLRGAHDGPNYLPAPRVAPQPGARIAYARQVDDRPEIARADSTSEGARREECLPLFDHEKVADDCGSDQFQGALGFRVPLRLTGIGIELQSGARTRLSVAGRADRSRRGSSDPCHRESGMRTPRRARISGARRSTRSARPHARPTGQTTAGPPALP